MKNLNLIALVSILTACGNNEHVNKLLDAGTSKIESTTPAKNEVPVEKPTVSPLDPQPEEPVLVNGRPAKEFTGYYTPTLIVQPVVVKQTVTTNVNVNVSAVATATAVAATPVVPKVMIKYFEQVCIILNADDAVVGPFAIKKSYTLWVWDGTRSKSVVSEAFFTQAAVFSHLNPIGEDRAISSQWKMNLNSTAAYASINYTNAKAPASGFQVMKPDSNPAHDYNMTWDCASGEEKTIERAADGILRVTL